MIKYLIISAIWVVTFISCSKDDSAPKPKGSFKTEMQVSVNSKQSVAGLTAIEITGEHDVNENKTRYILSENNNVVIKANPTLENIHLSVRIGGKNVFNDSIRINDNFIFSQSITEKYIDSIGGLIWR